MNKLEKMQQFMAELNASTEANRIKYGPDFDIAAPFREEIAKMNDLRKPKRRKLIAVFVDT